MVEHGGERDTTIEYNYKRTCLQTEDGVGCFFENGSDTVYVKTRESPDPSVVRVRRKTTKFVVVWSGPRGTGDAGVTSGTPRVAKTRPVSHVEP